MQSKLFSEKSTALSMERFKVQKGGSARGEMLDKFLAKLNPSRIAAGYKPLNHARLSDMLKHVPTEDLYPFYQECDKAKNFGALFNWKLRK